MRSLAFALLLIAAAVFSVTSSKTVSHAYNAGMPRVDLVQDSRGFLHVLDNTVDQTKDGDVSIYSSIASDRALMRTFFRTKCETKLGASATISELRRCTRRKMRRVDGADKDGRPSPAKPGLIAATGLTLDNCPEVSNNAQADIDTDGVGDACDPDNDGSI